MSNNNSILSSTNQTWKYVTKLLVHTGGHIFGALAIYFYFFDRDKAFPSLIIAGVIYVIGEFIGFSIKCPKCGVRWYWQALKKPVSDNSIVKIRTQSSCPKCGFTNGSIT